MAVKIRLRRTGRKKQPNYRLVVAESTTPRDGEYLDAVGTYNPLTRPADLRIDLEKVDQWLASGAEMTDTVASLVRKARRGGDATVAVRGVGAEAKTTQEVVGEAAEKPRPARAGGRGAAQVAAAAPSAEAPAAEAAEAPAAEAEAPAAEAAAEEPQAGAAE
jgi:small subunit ribosomal protein S16